MPKYEYKVIAIRGSEPSLYEAHLNECGAAGWELVQVESGLGYFKRAITETSK